MGASETVRQSTQRNTATREEMTMTPRCANKLLGRKAYVSNGDGISYQVVIQDHKKSWNKIDRFYVVPVAGDGGAWKEFASITLRLGK